MENVQPSNAVDPVRIYALSLLGSSKGAVFVNMSNDMTPDSISYGAMANLRNGYKDNSANGVSLLLSKAVKQGESLFWDGGSADRFGSKDASTGLAVRALMLAGADNDTIFKGIRYLSNSRKYDYWSNTYGTVQVMRALVDYSKKVGELNPDFEYEVKLGDTIISSGSVTSAGQKIDTLNLDTIVKGETAVLTITKNGTGKLYSTLILDQFRTQVEAAKRSDGISITREYTNTKDSAYSLAVGETVNVNLTMEGLAAGERYGVLEDQLPAGLVPINYRFENERRTGNYYDYNYYVREYTQNGVILSLYTVPAGKYTYTYKARVVSQGEFLTPPATVSLMYSPEISARSEAQIVSTSKDLIIIRGLSTPLSSRLADVFNANYSPKSRVLIIFAVATFGVIVMTVVIACTLIVVKGVDARRLFKRKSGNGDDGEK